MPHKKNRFVLRDFSGFLDTDKPKLSHPRSFAPGESDICMWLSYVNSVGMFMTARHSLCLLISATVERKFTVLSEK